jgi:mRNA interferase MazF
MASFEQGNIVKVPFPYTDRSTRQHRPALVVSAGTIGEHQSLLWVVMITSAENRPWPGDVAFGASYGKAGLPAPSVVRPCKIATIDADHAELLGKADRSLVAEVVNAVGQYLSPSDA